MVVQRSPAGLQISGITKNAQDSSQGNRHAVDYERVGGSLCGEVENITQTVKGEAFREGVLVWKEEAITNFEMDLGLVS